MAKRREYGEAPPRNQPYPPLHPRLARSCPHVEAGGRFRVPGLAPREGVNDKACLLGGETNTHRETETVRGVGVIDMLRGRVIFSLRLAHQVRRHVQTAIQKPMARPVEFADSSTTVSDGRLNRPTNGLASIHYIAFSHFPN